MNALSILTCINTRLFNHGLPAPVMGGFRFLFRKLTTLFLSKYKNEDIPIHGIIRKNLMVSFTSFPARIDDVWKVVVSLKNQTVLPEKIILWLSKDQFPTDLTIPASLWRQTGDMFEIKMVEGDIRSHKKHYYMLTQYPEMTFITCDDDVIYDSKMIERLVECSELYPGCIIANQTWKIRWKEDGNVANYDQWGPVGNPYEKEDLMQVGVGGVLYPPKCLHALSDRRDLFMQLIPMADDIWLNCMARLNGTPVVQSGRLVVNMPIENGSPSLCEVNNGQGENEKQLQKLREYLRVNHLEDVYYRQ